MTVHVESRPLNWKRILAAALMAGLCATVACVCERTSWTHHDATYGYGPANTTRDEHQRILDRLEWAVFACDLGAILSLAAPLFQLLRPCGPEAGAAGLLFLAGVLFLCLFSFALSLMDVSVEEQRAQAVPLRLLAIGTVGSAIGSFALGFASRRLWVKVLSVLLTAVALVFVMTRGS